MRVFCEEKFDIPLPCEKAPPFMRDAIIGIFILCQERVSTDGFSYGGYMPFEDLLKIMEKLRGPQGCPWDKDQDRESLRPFLIEELYELLEALDENDAEKIKEELGDLLFQIVFHCQLSKEMEEFDINDVVDRIAEKMIKRHPHVFGDKDIKTPEEVMVSWEEHKKKEKKQQQSVTDGVPRELPALLRAHRLQDRVSRVGFDWERIEDVFKKLEEELHELRIAVNTKDQRAIEEEIGDLFFVLVRVSSYVSVNPEDALRKTISKFIRRFRHIEMKAAEQGRRLSDMSLKEMDLWWEESKKKEEDKP
jgi:tetrapyrrole methylase family protein/MazG family protein